MELWEGLEDRKDPEVNSFASCFLSISTVPGAGGNETAPRPCRV